MAPFGTGRKLEDILQRQNFANDVSFTEQVRPGLDRTETIVTAADHAVVVTYKKQFDSEELMRKELALYTHFNSVLGELKPGRQPVEVHNHGKDANGKWFLETSFIEGSTWLDHMQRTQDPEQVKHYLNAALDETILHHVAAPQSMFQNDDNGSKAHEGIERFTRTLERDGIQADKEAYQNGVRTLVEQFLPNSTPYVDSWGKNLIVNEGRVTKIDFDKFGFYKGGMFFDLAHIIDGLETFTTEQRRDALVHAYQAHRELTAKFNDLVKRKRADATGTMLEFIDTYARDTQKYKEFVTQNKQSTLEQYLALFEANGMQTSSLKKAVDNLQEKEIMTEERFVLSYVAAKTIRCLASSGGYAEMRDGNKEFNKTQRADQLLHALSAVKTLEEHTLFRSPDYKPYMDLFKLRAELEKAYDALTKKPAPILKYSAPQKEYARAA
ncbi:hypothetical protein HY489_05940 [Candidatus Woesearchaeota archaeon]|nr:hypothetical protein [Candidatus Woesearchaeota archaeon]